ncbi:MAG: hypothetical protein KDJ51_09215 [Nitratireductor sp.]|nr:hypothetical protein [Nitratireductor sp.]
MNQAPRKRLAIVSSYSESCGNAAFTRVLHDTIEQYSEFDVEVVELDLRLLQSVNNYVRRKADIHIGKLCKQLATFDAVNLQLEAGLYGTLPNDIMKRVRRLLAANPVMSVTLHSPRMSAPTASTMRHGISELLRFRIISGMKIILDELRGNVHVRINRSMIRDAITHGHRLIAHTRRAKYQIGVFFDYDKVDVHPLKIVPEGFEPDHSGLEKIRRELGFKPEDKLIGIFGYISAYKGHHDALKAIEYLPENYKLLIFGRQHPQTIRANGEVDKYLGKLMGTIFLDEEKSRKHSLALARIRRAEENREPSLKDRVYFLGELPDREFLDVAASVDVAWLPYYENGQDGSGIASICLDASPRVVCSASFAFDQLFKLVEYRNVSRFDIGNSIELAHKTLLHINDKPPQRPYGDESVYTIRSQVDTYVKELTGAPVGDPAPVSDRKAG